MTEDRPPAPAGKITLIAPIIIGAVVVALLVGLLVLARYDRKPAAAPEPVPAPPVATATPPEAPVAPAGPLTRQDMIEAARREAAAYAGGTAPSKTRPALKGRSFVLHMPFGCAGQGSPAAAQAFVERDAARTTIKLVARPADWTTLPMLQGFPAGAGPEAVEGFWVTRPWTYAETCPPRRDGQVPATPTPAATQTLGLARLFDAEGSRALRRDGRAYEVVRKIPTEPAPPATAYRLVLEGHITAFPDGRPILCHAESPDHRPICLFAVAFDRVAFETADGQLLAEWRE